MLTRFVADAMLGRLARWLRVLGFDTISNPRMSDADMVALAVRDDRILLTRDRHLLRERRPPRALEVLSDAPLLQLRDVIEALDLHAPAELFTRCLVCNAPLADVPEDEIATLVPPAARDLPGPVRRCPECARTYWPGSHVRRMRRTLEGALPGWIG